VKLTALVVFLVLAVAASASASGVPSERPPAKPDAGVEPPVGHLQGGDTFESAVVIEGLPYHTTGTTAGYNDDYDEACPYTGSTSPDVVYQWTADFSGPIDIVLCESSYDTKVYVFENEYVPGEWIACNDDNGDCPGPPYRSWIEYLEITEGNTYYVVVDGYGGDFGDYLFSMHPTPFAVPCEVTCPPGAFDENEPDCYDGYVDETNGGCGGFPPIWQHPGLNTYVCGTSGNYDDNMLRDLDWFEFTLDEDRTLEVSLCAEFPVRFWIFDGSGGCAEPQLVMTDAIVANYLLVNSVDLGPGTWWFIVSVDGWFDIPCGSPYVASLFEYGYTPIEDSSWGMIKTMYRQ
jgi:hypothetical protein